MGESGDFTAVAQCARFYRLNRFDRRGNGLANEVLSMWGSSLFVMAKNRLTVFLFCSAVSFAMTSETLAAGDGNSGWIEHFRNAKGDVYFYDPSRVEKTQDLRSVWSRIRYKSSVMGASSYQSLLEINCSKRTVKKSQSTFFTDKQWNRPAMATDMKEKPERRISVGSATERLTEIMCD